MTKWYNNIVAYALDVGVFYDSNGDGVGDFKGATQKLDYLAEIGINCIWLLPFFYSPDKDNGYDVSDYFQVNPKFGTMDDFVEFLREAEKRSMRVILDLVINHTSTEHPWFKAARNNAQSSYFNYYIWRKELPAEKEENVFKGTESGTWKYDEQVQQYYYHKFYHFEADLNMQNPRVREEVRRIMEYWLSFGISGFRLDAATRLFEQSGNSGQTTSPEEILKEFRSYAEEIKEDAILLAEADVVPEKIKLYVGEGDRMHMMLNFLLNNSLFLALARKEATPLAERIKSLPELPESACWMNFIRNLDELDLEQLTVGERQEVFKELAPNPQMQIYERGIRRRIAPMLQGNIDRLKMVHNLLFAMPGTPLIAYGDEIGMGDNLAYKARQAVRTPMQWNSATNGGFSDLPGHQIPIPPINHGIFCFDNVNVEDQLKDASSLLSKVKELIEIRQKHSLIGEKKPEVLDTGDKAILGLKYQQDSSELLVYTNLSSEEKSISAGISLQDFNTLLEDKPYGIREAENTISLRAYGFRWFEKRR